MSAGDFYFAINGTFRFILDNYGEQALFAYWRAMGNDYFRSLSSRFREGGLEEVERYWRDFFAAEPAGDVDVTREDAQVEIDVRDCPAIRWLRRHHREIVPVYCQHCHHVSTAIAENAGLHFTLEGGGGTCRQVFRATDQESAP